MQQGFDPTNSWSSMTEQFRRVFGDDFVQSLMKSINLSEMMGGAGLGSAMGGGGGRMGATADGGAGGPASGVPGSSGIPGFGSSSGMPGMPSIPGFPNMTGFPFGGQTAGQGSGQGVGQGSGQSAGQSGNANGAGSGGIIPRVDVVQTRHEVVVWIELPGAEPGDVKMQATPEVLYIRGNLRRPYSVAGDDQIAIHELFRGEFKREIALPVRVKSEKVRANYRQGLLEVRMLKAEPENGPRGQEVPIRFD